MKHSEHLRQKIHKTHAVVEMFSSPGWNTILEEKIEPLEFASWRDWKGIPAEDHERIVEAQQAGKIAEMVRRWQAEYESQLEMDRRQLREIESKLVEDEDLDIPEEEEGTLRRWLNKYQEWMRQVRTA